MPKVVARFEKVSLEQFTKDLTASIDEGKLIRTGATETALAHLESTYNEIALPHRKTKGAGGHDFIAPFDIIVNPGQTTVIPTGIRCMIDEGYTLDLYPRSGQGFKYRLRLNNTIGIIDEDYYFSDNEGHIMVKLSNEGDKVFECEKGTAFCQGLFHEYFIAEGNEDPEATRNGGMGSTGM